MGKSLSDVLIVGGGVIGCLTAYYLSKADLKVTLIEADQVACGASGKSGGWLTPYSHANDPAMLALSPKSLDLHRTLSKVLPEETGVDYGFEETPFLRCAITEEGVSELQSWQVERAAEGNVMEWISPSDIRQVNSWVTDRVLGGLLSNDEPTLDSYKFTHSSMQAAEKYGANIVSGRVTGLVCGKRQGHSAGVTLEDGSMVEGGSVLLAMGPWTGAASAWTGSTFPIAPQRGQLLYLSEPDNRHGVRVESGFSAVEVPVSIIRKRLSENLLGSTREDVGFDISTTASARDLLMSQFAMLSDRANSIGISAQTACLRPVTPDGRPYVGRAPLWDNVYVAAGHASEGIHYAPVTARVMADLIIDGETNVDISALSPARMDEC